MLIYIAFLYFFIAATFTLSKGLVTFFSPLLLSLLRFSLGGILLASWALFFHKKKQLYIKKDDYIDFFIIVLMMYCFGFVLDNYAIMYVNSSISSLIYNLHPFVTAILSYFLFKQKITNRQLLGLIFGFCSIYSLIFYDFYFSHFYKNFFTTSTILFGYGGLFIAMITSSYAWIIFSKLLKKGYSSIMIHAVGLLGAFFLMSFLALLFLFFNIPIGLQQITIEQPLSITGSFIVDLFLLILISHIICGTLYGFLLQQYSPTLIAFAGFLTPFFVSIFGVIFLNETINLQLCLAMIGASIGLMLFYYDEKGGIRVL